MTALKKKESANSQKYFMRNGLKFRRYKNSSEAAKIMLTIRDANVIALLEQASVNLGSEPTNVPVILELFVIKALKAGIEF